MISFGPLNFTHLFPVPDGVSRRAPTSRHKSQTPLSLALNEDAELSKLGSIVTTVTCLRERRLNRRIDQLAVIGVLN